MSDSTISYHQEANIFGSILDIINNAVLIVDSKNIITFANQKTVPMFMVGNTNDLVGQPVTNIFMPDDREIMALNILHLARSTKDFEGEIMLLKADQTEFMAMLAASLLDWRGEKNAVISIHDISHLKIIENTLRRTERVAFLGHLLDDINHQIRNPIIVIGGLAKRISKQDRPKPALTNAIVKEAKRLEDLLDTIHAFSNLSSPCFRQVAVLTLVDRLEPLLHQATNQPGQIICEDKYLNQKVSIDLDLFCLAISLIIQNAVEAAIDDPADIKISIGGPDGDPADRPSFPLSVKISDQGVGINQADLAKIVEPFFTRKTFHHGMGLTIAKRIITEQDGEIRIISEAGKGTVVQVFMVSERRRPIRTEKYH